MKQLKSQNQGLRHSPSPSDGSKTKEVGVESNDSLPKNQLVYFDRNNFPYYILLQIESLLYDSILTQKNNKKNNGELVPLEETNLTNLLAYVYSNNSCRRIVKYFFDYGAATSTTLMKTLNMTRQSCYYNLENLVKAGVIIEGKPIKRPKGTLGGPKVVLYRTPNVTPDQIIEAERTHEKLVNPRYISGNNYAQLIMEDYLFKEKREISKQQIYAVLRSRNEPNVIDLADLIAYLLRQRGWKVWI